MSTHQESGALTWQHVLNLVATFVLLFGATTISELSIWDQPIEEWTIINFEALALRTFTAVIFAVVLAYTLGPVCTCACGGLVKFVGRVASVARTVAGLYSNHGDKGVLPFALILAKVLVNWGRGSRFVRLLVLGDEVAIVAFVVFPVAICVLPFRYSLRAFAYARGFIAGVVNLVDLKDPGCVFLATSSRSSGHKQNLALQSVCNGETDGSAALSWWNDLRKNDIIVWDLFLPIFIYTVAVMFCISIIAVVVFNKRTKAEIGTQTDSTGDLKGDSTGLSEKVNQRLVQIREFEGRSDTTDATVARQSEETQLKDRKIQDLATEFNGMREVNAHLQAEKEDQPSQGQDLAERLSKANDDDSALNQMHEQLAQEKGLRILVAYSYLGLKQLAEIFGRVAMREHFLKFTREIESRCDAMATSGIKSLEEVQAILGTGLGELLRDASSYAATIRLPKQSKRLNANPNAVVLKRKFQRQRRHTRLLLKKLGQVPATTAEQARQIETIMRDEHTRTVENMREEHKTTIDFLGQQINLLQQRANVAEEASNAKETELEQLHGLVNEGLLNGSNDSFLMSGEINLRDQEIANLKALLAESQAKVSDLESQQNQGPAQDTNEQSAALQMLQHELDESKQRERAREAEVRKFKADVFNLRAEMERLRKEELFPGVKREDLEQMMGDANRKHSEDAQKVAALQDKLDSVTEELTALKDILETADNCLRVEHQRIDDDLLDANYRVQQLNEAVNASAPAQQIVELQQQIELWEIMRNRLVTEIRQLKGAYEPDNDINPETPIWIDDLKDLLEEEQVNQHFDNQQIDPEDYA